MLGLGLGAVQAGLAPVRRRGRPPGLMLQRQEIGLLLLQLPLEPLRLPLLLQLPPAALLGGRGTLSPGPGTRLAPAHFSPARRSPTLVW